MNETTTSTRPFLSDRVYNAFKWVALILLPAFGAFYYGLSDIWGLPKAEEVVGTTAIVDAFLGTLLKASSSQFSKAGADGSVTLVAADEDTTTVKFSVDPNLLFEKKQVTLNVDDPGATRI